MLAFPSNPNPFLRLAELFVSGFDFNYFHGGALQLEKIKKVVRFSLERKSVAKKENK